jgi:protein-disulfide isomerase
MTPNQPRPTRSEQREATRQKAREMREASARKERNKSLTLRVSLIVGILVAVSLIAVAIISGVNQQAATSAGPANLIYDNGIKIGANLEAFTKTQTPAPTPSAGASAGKTVPNIVIYMDYQCPICQTFEQGNSDQLRQWVKSGAATVEYHPISFLDGRGSPNTYSSRAANAALCVANYSPNQFFDFTAALFAHQPAEGTPGPENPALVQRTTQLGVQQASKIADCINNKTYGKWLENTTSTVLGSNYRIKGTNIAVTGTPTISVNGKQYAWTTEAELVSPARFAAWFQQAIKG